MKVYVASSWRNPYHDQTVRALLSDGHEVYNFRTDGMAFNWNQLDPSWKQWSVNQFLSMLNTPAAVEGFNADMKALQECDVCLMVMPCGSSAFIETGWAVGHGKITMAYCPEMREPELMVRMIGFISTDLSQIREAINHL